MTLVSQSKASYIHPHKLRPRSRRFQSSGRELSPQVWFQYQRAPLSCWSTSQGLYGLRNGFQVHLIDAISQFMSYLLASAPQLASLHLSPLNWSMFFLPELSVVGILVQPSIKAWAVILGVQYGFSTPRNLPKDFGNSPALSLLVPIGSTYLFWSFLCWLGPTFCPPV